MIIIIIHSLHSATHASQRSSGALQNSDINIKSINYNGIKLLKINENEATAA